MHHPAMAMTHGFPLRGITAPVVISFAIGYGIGMVLNATFLLDLPCSKESQSGNQSPEPCGFGKFLDEH